MLPQNGGAVKPYPKFNSASAIYVHGRIVGHVFGDTFCKSCRGSKHMLHTPRAWASDLSALRAALAAGATHIEIFDTETGATYRAGIAAMLRDGFEFDRGFGLQVALPLGQWLRPDLGQGEQLTLFAETEAAR